MFSVHATLSRWHGESLKSGRAESSQWSWGGAEQ